MVRIPMDDNPREQLRRALELAKRRTSRADEVRVHSRQEINALREWLLGKKPRRGTPVFAGPIFGFPVYIDDSVPPGIMRFMNGDRILRDVRVR